MPKLEQVEDPGRESDCSRTAIMLLPLIVVIRRLHSRSHYAAQKSFELSDVFEDYVVRTEV
jgi:hypothetical protein